ncbi:MAG: LCP family protein [Candidatus Doudnabacteria bacterium]|nr:LCP family protein [Candidatus Doudnabacteria bacterium]
MKSIDAINPNQNSSYNDVRLRKQRPKRRYGCFLLVVILILSGLLVWGASNLLSKTNRIFTGDKNVFQRVGQLFVGGDKKLIGEDDGQVNVLLLGYGGPGHDGPYLTDTIIVASLDMETDEVVLVSIPRDFVVQLPGLGFRKINSAYAFFRDDNDPNSAGEAAVDAASKLTGLEIPYYAAIDFQGFVKAINQVGGVDVVIDRTFTDSSYPDERYGFLAPVTFTAGSEHMDGERALIFARSRKGTNNEGSDFARSERQKKVIQAFKDKVVKLGITDLRTINNLLSVFTDNFRTNLEPYQLQRLIELGKDIDNEHAFSLSLEPDNVLICNGIIGDYENRAYVVQPCEGKTLTDVHNYIANASKLAKLSKEAAEVEVQNSTQQAYVLGPFRALNNLGMEVNFRPFLQSNKFSRTILYDNSGNLKPETRKYLEENFDLTVADLPFNNSNADFVIIIGQDAL